MQGLFRKQALDHQKQGLYGEVLLLPRVAHGWLVFLLMAWAVAVLAWLFTSHYARKETVSGWLEPPQGVVRVYAETAGIVQKVLVADGDAVTQDQPLLIISDERTLASGASLDAKLLTEYQTQSRLLEEQITRTESSYSERQQSLAKRIASAQADLQLIAQQRQLLAQRLAFATAQLERFRALQQAGHVSTLEVDNANTQVLTLKSDQQTLLRNGVAQTNLIQQLESEQTLLPTENANSLDQLRSRLSDITQQTTQLNGRSGHIIKAPRAGIVNNVQASEGQQTGTANIPMLTIFPSNATLSVQLLVPVRAAGFIEPGQNLAIRYDAFPYQKFGIYTGTIAQVSKTLLLPNELLNTPVSTNQPVYRITAQLAQANVQAYGKNFSLKPGMTLSADISLGDRTLMQWLLEPIYSLKGRL